MLVSLAVDSVQREVVKQQLPVPLSPAPLFQAHLRQKAQNWVLSVADDLAEDMSPTGDGPDTPIGGWFSRQVQERSDAMSNDPQFMEIVEELDAKSGVAEVRVVGMLTSLNKWKSRWEANAVLSALLQFT